MNNSGACIVYDNEDTSGPLYALCSYDNHIGSRLQTTIEQVKKFLDVDIVTGIGKSFRPKEMKNDVLHEARKVLKQYDIFRRKNVITYDDYRSVENNDYVLNEEIRHSLKKRIENIGSNPKELKQAIEKICCEMQKQKVCYGNRKATWIGIVLLLFNEIKTKNPDLYMKIMEGDRAIEQYFDEIYTIEQFENRIFELIDTISELAKEDVLIGGRRIVSDMIKRIESEYFRTDIRLSLFADEYYINQSYLSTLFVKETGKNFSKYLTDVRLKKSKELLATTDFSVSRIAEFVGYSDRSYFASVFQKMEGMSPAAYRKLVKENMFNEE